MIDFDSADMLARNTCSFFDCSEQSEGSIEGHPVCSDCLTEIENGERGICSVCESLWIIGPDTGCDCHPYEDECDLIIMSDADEVRLNNLAAEKNGVRL